MLGDYYELSTAGLLFAAALILINGIISIVLKLGLERRLLLASVRTIVQLSLIGLLLNWIFKLNQWYVIVPLMLIMTLIAGYAAVRQVDRRYPGIWLNSMVSVMAGSWLVTAIALVAVVPPHVWSHDAARYAIPLLGMILGNTLNGISLGLDRLSEQLSTNRAQVELLLTLGATRRQAARQWIQQAVRTGMIPIINSMMVVGLVSLPGMMTGQLLAGVAPVEAVKYQIAIMFLIAAGTALGTISAVMLSYLRLFNGRHQFLYERITSR